MTSVSPTTTRFVLNECYIIAAYLPSTANYTLPVLRTDGAIRISEDQDRDNFLEVTLELDWLPPHIYAALDPRAQNTLAAAPIRMRMTELAGDGTILRYWPGFYAATDEDLAWLWIRRIQRNWASRTMTLTLSSGEPFLDDRIRLAGTSVDTAATTVRNLVNYSLGDVFAASLGVYSPIVNTTAIPAGDRRLFQPGQSHLDLIKSELDAIDCRLYDMYGRIWNAELRTTVAAEQVRLSTSPDYGTNCDPIVWEVTDTLSRDGRWADGVLIEYDTRAFGGTVAWQRSGSGSHTKGTVVHRTRPAPTANAADKLATRTALRGRDTDVTARARLDVRTRCKAAIFTFDATLQGDLRAVEYSFPEGTMRLRIEQ